MKTLLNRVNEKISYTKHLLHGCQVLAQFALNEICPASWEDRRVDIALLMTTRRRYDAELRKYHRRLQHYEKLKNKRCLVRYKKENIL